MWAYDANLNVIWTFSGNLGNTPIPYDIDGDGNLTVADALTLIKSVVNGKTVKNGDVNGDGDVTDADAGYLLRHVLFPHRYTLY